MSVQKHSDLICQWKMLKNFANKIYLLLKFIKEVLVCKNIYRSVTLIMTNRCHLTSSRSIYHPRESQKPLSALGIMRVTIKNYQTMRLMNINRFKMHKKFRISTWYIKKLIQQMMSTNNKIASTLFFILTNRQRVYSFLKNIINLFK